MQDLRLDFEPEDPPCLRGMGILQGALPSWTDTGCLLR